jgi:hypothetical protein
MDFTLTAFSRRQGHEPKEAGEELQRAEIQPTLAAGRRCATIGNNTFHKPDREF